MSENEPKRKQQKLIFRKSAELDDSQLIQTSRAWHKLFLPHVAEFEALDPDMNATFATDWLALIEDFALHPTDAATLAELGNYTSLTDNAADKVFVFLEQLEYIVRKAFPKDKRKLLEFGFTDIRKLRHTNFSRMVVRCFVVQAVANEYHTALDAAGLDAAFYTDYEAACQELVEAEIQQEYFKTVRIRRTTKRIKLFNELYELHMRVQKAAAIIFKTQPEVAKQFVL